MYCLGEDFDVSVSSEVLVIVISVVSAAQTVLWNTSKSMEDQAQPPPLAAASLERLRHPQLDPHPTHPAEVQHT